MKSKIGSLLLAFVVSFALWIYVITVVSPDSDATINGIAVELLSMLQKSMQRASRTHLMMFVIPATYRIMRLRF